MVLNSGITMMGLRSWRERNVASHNWFFIEHGVPDCHRRSSQPLRVGIKVFWNVTLDTKLVVGRCSRGLMAGGD
jgi:hypothetical protein